LIPRVYLQPSAPGTTPTRRSCRARRPGLVRAPPWGGLAGAVGTQVERDPTVRRRGAWGWDLDASAIEPLVQRRSLRRPRPGPREPFLRARLVTEARV